jgi:hypothetical protein
MSYMISTGLPLEFFSILSIQARLYWKLKHKSLVFYDLQGLGKMLSLPFPIFNIK